MPARGTKTRRLSSVQPFRASRMKRERFGLSDRFADREESDAPGNERKGVFWRDATSAKRTGCVAMKDRMMEMLEVQIQYVRNQKTGLIVAMSDDHRGLYVHGRTMEEVEERIPQALRALLEAEGKNVIEVSLQDDEAVTKSGFYPSTAKFSASFATAA